jgi:hypothetical protein
VPTIPKTGGEIVSRSVDLFIRAEQSLAELASIVCTITGLPFTPGPRDGTFVTRDDHFEAVLRQHGDADDGLLSRYPYALSAAVDDGVRVQEAPATVMLRLVADQLQRQGGLAALLVLDLQYREGTTRSAATAEGSSRARGGPASSTAGVDAPPRSAGGDSLDVTRPSAPSGEPGEAGPTDAARSRPATAAL